MNIFATYTHDIYTLGALQATSSILICAHVYLCRYLTRFHGDCQMNLNSVERIIEYCEVPSERYGEEDNKGKGTGSGDKSVLKSGGSVLGIDKKRLNKRRGEKGELYSLLPHTGEEMGEEDGSDTDSEGNVEVEERKEEEVSDTHTSTNTTSTTTYSPLNGDSSDDVTIDVTASLQTRTGNNRGEGAIEFRQVQLKYRISDPPVLR